MTTPAKSKPGNLHDVQVDKTLDRIRRAVDRVADELQIEQPFVGDSQQRTPRSDGYARQPDRGLLRTAFTRGTMLITKEAPERTTSEPPKAATDDLAGHVSSVLRELNTVRNETKRLLDQRRQLEVYLSALKTELETMRAEKVELMALKAQIMPHAAGEAQVDLVERARAAAGGPAPVAAAPPTPLTPTSSSPTSEGPASSAPGGVAPRSDHDEDAFRAFLQADVDHDKSREWFMSQSH